MKFPVIWNLCFNSMDNSDKPLSTKGYIISHSDYLRVENDKIVPESIFTRYHIYFFIRNLILLDCYLCERQHVPNILQWFVILSGYLITITWSKESYFKRFLRAYFSKKILVIMCQWFSNVFGYQVQWHNAAIMNEIWFLKIFIVIARF